MEVLNVFLKPSSRWYYSLRCLALVLLGLAIYARTFGFKFVFDDISFIVMDPFIRRFDHVHYLFNTYPQTRLLGFYSFAFNYLINRSNPLGYHVFNFIVHLANVGLVWALADLILRITQRLPSKDQFTTEIPFIIAVLFLVHPCQTQAVTYISQRFESMATLFYLGSVYFYLRGRAASLKAHKIFLFICTVGFAVLGILTKEVAATIPLMILAGELILFKGNHRKISMALIVSGLVFFLLFTKLAHSDLSIFFHFKPIASQSHDGDVITAKEYVLTQMRVFLTLSRLSVFPVHQNLDYDYPLSRGLLDPPLTLLGICWAGTMAVAIFKLRRKFPVIAFGLAWVLTTFSINLAPRANVIFEHKFYLVSFGFFLIVVNILDVIIHKRKLVVQALIIVISAFSILSFLRNQVWDNELTLWKDTAEKSPP